MTHPDEDGPPEFEPPPFPGPDLYTLLAWVEVELAAHDGVTVDAAHAIVTEGAERAFGRQVFEWTAEALRAEGRLQGHDDVAGLRALRADEFLAQRVLARLRERMGEDEEAPDPPDTDYYWSAYSPDDPAGSRTRFRQARRDRRHNAREALLTPPRPRVAGRRAH